MWCAPDRLLDLHNLLPIQWRLFVRAHGVCVSARVIKMSVCTSAHVSKIAAQCAMEVFRVWIHPNLHLCEQKNSQMSKGMELVREAQALLSIS